MEITWSGVVGMLGIGAFGYWLGKKALPKVKRIEETEHLRALANKIQEAAQTPEHCREADAILREIDEYIEQGISDESVATASSEIPCSIYSSISRRIASASRQCSGVCAASWILLARALRCSVSSIRLTLGKAFLPRQ